MRLRCFARLLAAWIGIALLSVATATDNSATINVLATRGLMLGAARAGERFVAVGEFGHIVLSDDLGQTWRQAKQVPTRTTLTAVTFVDPAHGWAVGHGGQVLATTDGGETWRVQFGKIDGLDSLFSVWFENPQHGVAVGPFGYAISTDDGGQTWHQFYVAEGEDGERHLNGLFAGRDGRLLIAAETGAVFVSDDGGAGWRLVTLPYEGSLWGGMALRDGSLVVWGMTGHALRSRDNGETWTELVTGTNQSLTAGVELAAGGFALVGLGGAVTVAAQDLTFAATIRDDRQLSAAVLGTPDGLLLFTTSGIVTHPLKALQ
jgi:photosystem II stability/assembly factor-like uncharacterized protein